MIIAVKFKNSGLNGIRKNKLCDTCTVLPQLSYQANCQRSISAFKENGQLATKILSCWLIWSQLGIWDLILCMRIILTQESHIMLSYTLCMRRILALELNIMHAQNPYTETLHDVCKKSYTEILH